MMKTEQLYYKLPYIKNITSKVISCTPFNYDKKECFQAVLDRTVFFPEGGGQIADSNVLNVNRDNKTGVIYHIVDKEIDGQVECQVDWERREDHMQHHSGQHLISAIFEKEYNLPTVSWELSSRLKCQPCNIELNAANFDIKNFDELLAKVESKVNGLIRSKINVNVLNLNKDQACEKFNKEGQYFDNINVDTENIRAIEIGDGVDVNMCCGTHISNLAELQAVKLLGYEKARKTCVRLYFLAGNRMLKKFSMLTENEVVLNKVLG